MNPKRTSEADHHLPNGHHPFRGCGFLGADALHRRSGLGFYLVLGGVAALVLGIGFCWAFTNFFTFLLCPREYRLWKAGGGDPFFDTLDSPLNNDPPSTRLQELYREKARQECEEVDRMFGLCPNPPVVLPDLTRGIDDLDVI